MKNGLITLTAIASLGLGGDAAIYNGATLIDTTIPVAEEVVALKQVDNVVEATFPWKDQAGIKVKYDLGEPTVTEKFKDKRKKEVITETVTDFDGGFKVDLLLNEKPDTNVFCYAIEGAENYDFFFQPPLTEQEKAEGARRPPEIEGSYAVYHKTLKNHVLGQENYATGKVMHIPRPQVWSMSDVDTKVWADMTYDNGSLCVTVPQDFLNGADYPVRVDPTFGYTSVGVTCRGVVLNMINFSVSTSTVTQRADRASITSNSLCGPATGVSAKVVVATDSDNTVIANGVTATATDPTVNVWTTQSFPNKPTITSGVGYILGVVFNNYNIGVAMDTTGGIGGYGSINFYNPTTTYSVTSNADKVSIYLTLASEPTISTTGSDPRVSSASLFGTLSADNDSIVTMYGFAYGTSSDLSSVNTATTTTSGSVSGLFSYYLTNLSPLTTYYFRAYAVSSMGTSTGSILSFTTIVQNTTRINNGTIRINNGKLDI